MLATWAHKPLGQRSYSYLRVGQYTTVRSFEAIPEEPNALCGSTTCLEYRGYTEAAVRRGERAAREAIEATS